MGNCGSAATGTVLENIGINSNLRQRVIERVNRHTIDTNQQKKITNQIKIQPSDDFDENKNNPLYQHKIRLYKDPAWWQFWKSPEPCSDPLPLFACTYNIKQGTSFKLSSFTNFTNKTSEEIYNDIKQEMIKNNDSDVSGIQNNDLTSALNKARNGSTRLIQNLFDKMGNQTSEEGTSTIINYSYPIRCNINKDDCTLDNPEVTQNVQSEIISNEILNIVTEQILRVDREIKSKLEKKTDTKNNTCIYIIGGVSIAILIALFFIIKSFISGGSSGKGLSIPIGGGKRFKIINSKNKPIFLIIIIISILYINGFCN